MALLSAAIIRDSLSFIMFPLRIHVHVFSSAVSSFCRLKSPYFHFSSRFCFLILLFFRLVLFCRRCYWLWCLVFLRSFLCSSSSYRIDVSTLSSMLPSPLSPSFLDTYTLSMLSLRCQEWYIVISFLVLWFISWRFSLVQLRMISSILQWI